MCEKCNQLDELVEKAMAPVLEAGLKVEEAKFAAGETTITPGTKGIPSVAALAMLRRGLLTMVERDECGPETVLKAMMYVLEPLFEGMGVTAGVTKVEVGSAEAEAIENALLLAKAPVNKLPA